VCAIVARGGVVNATDFRRYPRPNERGLGPATSRQLWRLNQEGMLAIRKEPGTPIANRQAAHLIGAIVDQEQRARFAREAARLPPAVEREPPIAPGARVVLERRKRAAGSS
jgi:hypothetical protein